MINILDGTLACPKCLASTWTHLDTVIITNAANETVSIQCSGEDLGARMTLNLTPDDQLPDPGRRHTVGLVISCEECGETSRIGFQQHKGQTFVSEF